MDHFGSEFEDASLCEFVETLAYPSKCEQGGDVCLEAHVLQWR